MARITDGDFTTAGQNGSKQLSLALQDAGQYYATLITRNYNALIEYWEPLRGQLTGYTQLLTYSDDASNAAWTKNATTGAASTATDPEGGTGATKVAEDNTTAAHNITQALTVASGALSLGVIAKAAERSYLRLRLYNATDGNFASAVFDLSAGTVTTGTGTIKKLLNGWYWCRVSGTATVSNSAAFFDLSADGSTWSYAGTTGSGVRLFRATAIAAAPTANWPAIISTAATRAVTVPAVDADDPLAFLVGESGPDASSTQFGVAQWSRQYANVPANVVRYSSLAFTKPSASLQNGATNYTYQITDRTGVTPSGANVGYATNFSNSLFVTNGKLYSPAKSSGAITQVLATAGTFTITYKTSTTAAINYNETAVNITTAVNLLADVIADGLVLVVSYQLSVQGFLLFTVSVGTTTSPFTANTAGLTPAAATHAFPMVASPTSQTLNLGLTAVITSHGFAASGNMVAIINSGSNGSYLFDYANSWLVLDANTLLLKQGTAGYIAVCAPYLKPYTPGAARIGTRVTQSFYLPGFTPGIITASDIPLPQILLSDTTFLNAVVSTTAGYMGYDANARDIWKAPIYQQEVIEINAGDL